MRYFDHKSSLDYPHVSLTEHVDHLQQRVGLVEDGF